jgi:hypothetical protein
VHSYFLSSIEDAGPFYTSVRVYLYAEYTTEFREDETEDERRGRKESAQDRLRQQYFASAKNERKQSPGLGARSGRGREAVARSAFEKWEEVSDAPAALWAPQIVRERVGK